MLIIVEELECKDAKLFFKLWLLQRHGEVLIGVWYLENK